jgi:excinuclease ABC subunit B
MSFTLGKNQKITRKKILKNLVEIQYEREETNFKRGTFRVRGDVIEVFPSYEDFAYRIELDENKIMNISSIDRVKL